VVPVLQNTSKNIFFSKVVRYDMRPNKTRNINLTHPIEARWSYEAALDYTLLKINALGNNRKRTRSPIN
jgi:hypothetical protein